jgi:hypothetical protein
MLQCLVVIVVCFSLSNDVRNIFPDVSKGKLSTYVDHRKILTPADRKNDSLVSFFTSHD